MKQFLWAQSCFHLIFSQGVGDAPMLALKLDYFILNQRKYEAAQQPSMSSLSLWVMSYTTPVKTTVNHVGIILTSVGQKLTSHLNGLIWLVE